MNTHINTDNRGCRLRKIMVGVLALIMLLGIMPTTAFAQYDSITIDGNYGDSPGGNVYAYTYTVGDTVTLRFNNATDTGVITSTNISAGSLPSGLSLSIVNPTIHLTGTVTNATSGAQSATIWGQDANNDTQTRAITFTINKTSPTISGSNTLSGAVGFMSKTTASATIADGWFGGTTTSMALTATINDGANTATASATATGANVSFDFPAAQLNALAVGGPYDITVSAFAGNNNNDGFAATKIGEFTVTEYAPTITGDTALSLTLGYAATSTGTYTVGGAPAATVTQDTNHGGQIIWNNTTKKLDIAAGLAVGSYPVVLTASNGVAPDATLTFTLRVAKASALPKTGDDFPTAELSAALVLLATVTAVMLRKGRKMKMK